MSRPGDFRLTNARRGVIGSLERKRFFTVFESTKEGKGRGESKVREGSLEINLLLPVRYVAKTISKTIPFVMRVNLKLLTFLEAAVKATLKELVSRGENPWVMFLRKSQRPDGWRAGSRKTATGKDLREDGQTLRLRRYP
ncbi:hypothetical protein RUM43_006276 [Polyplax serrata]|uniref:Uncharacterized protein n=1 Tax=Polyplax serrata TaxID=468196 RepID=A0AAN8S5C7_POLSC